MTDPETQGDDRGVHMEQTWTLLSQPSLPDADTDQTVQWHYT